MAGIGLRVHHSLRMAYDMMAERCLWQSFQDAGADGQARVRAASMSREVRLARGRSARPGLRLKSVLRRCRRFAVVAADWCARARVSAVRVLASVCVAVVSGMCGVAAGGGMAGAAAVIAPCPGWHVRTPLATVDFRASAMAAAAASVMPVPASSSRAAAASEASAGETG